MAIDPNTVWEVRTGGAQTNGAGFRWVSLVNAIYRWILSAGGTNEYYCELAAGGDPTLVHPGSVTLDGKFNLAAEGVLGTLAAGEWGYGNNDGLAFNTVYVRLADGTDPDTKIARGQPGYVQMGFNGGIDYSQQNAAQLSLIDIATDGAGTQLTSATGGFTAAMVGNVIYLTGGGCWPEWYQIATYIDANNVTIDRSAGPNLLGVTGKVGGAFALGGANDNEFGAANHIVPSNHVFIAAGTYNLGEICTWSAAGTAQLRVTFEGYHATRGDRPTYNDRPLIAAGADRFLPAGVMNVWANLRFTGSDVWAFALTGGGTLVFNCRAENTSAAADKSAFYTNGGGSTFLACEGVCAGQAADNYGFHAAGQGQFFIGCYAKHCGKGFYLWSNYEYALLCVAADCHVTGIELFSLYSRAILCTIYDSDRGIEADDQTMVLNNIIDGCTTGIYAKDVDCQTVFALFNCLHNTTDFSRMGGLLNSNIIGDPGLKNPAAQDFRVDGADANVYEKAAEASQFTDAKL